MFSDKAIVKMSEILNEEKKTKKYIVEKRTNLGSAFTDEEAFALFKKVGENFNKSEVIKPGKYNRVAKDSWIYADENGNMFIVNKNKKQEKCSESYIETIKRFSKSRG